MIAMLLTHGGDAEKPFVGFHDEAIRRAFAVVPQRSVVTTLREHARGGARS